ncbi:ATPase expression protein 3 [Monosporozyma servazzii]
MIRVWKRLLHKDITSIVKQNKHLIGKDSSFTKKLILNQLSPIKQATFKRGETLNTKYDDEKATTLYKLKNDILKDPELSLLIDQNFINQIIPILLSLPFKNELNKEPHKNRNNNDTDNDNEPNEKLPRIIERVPPLPNFSENPDLFSQYIRLITHAKIIKGQNLPILLRTLANPLNNTTTPLQTIQTYNDILFYFKNHWDFASMREIFKFINLHLFVQPNIITFNIILSSLSQNNKIRKEKDIIIELKFYLKMMNQLKIQIDNRTLEIISSFLTTSQGKLQFIQLLKQNGIIVDDWMKLQVMKEYPTEMINYIEGNKINLTSRLINVVVKSCLHKNDLSLAWNFIYRSANPHIVNDQTLNYLLVPLSNHGKIDECLLLYKWFNNKMGTKGNLQTFELLLKSHVRNGYSKRFGLIYEWLNELCKQNTKLSFAPNNYWKLKCQSIIKFNCINGKVIEIADHNKMNKLYSTFNLETISYNGKDTIWNLSQNKPEMRKFLRLLNVVKSRVPSKHKSSHIVNTEDTRIAKRKYLSRRKNIAITHSSFKKLSYSDDWYKALNKEFG